MTQVVPRVAPQTAMWHAKMKRSTGTVTCVVGKERAADTSSQ